MKCIIVDDEYPSREELKYFLKEFPEIELVGEMENPLNAIEILQKKKIDVVFLDINMPGLDGMSLGRMISRFEDPPKIVFITAYDSYALDAFEVQAFDYIMKPYSEERIRGMLDRLCKSKVILSKNQVLDIDKKITLWANEKMFVLSTDDILYCEAFDGITKVVFEEGEYTYKGRLSDLEERLDQLHFYKTHRSYVVNIAKIEEIIPWFNTTYNLRLSGTRSLVPVSRSKVKEFREIMKI